MPGRNQKGQQPTLIRGAMKCSLSVFLLCVVVVVSTVLVQPGVQNVHAAGSSVTNDPVGDLVVFSQDYNSMSTVPGNKCLAEE